MNWRIVVKRLLAPMLVLMLSWAMVSCSQSGSIARKPLLSRSQPRLSEIAPPESIQELKQYTDIYQPQVTILSPRSNEVLEDTTASVKLQVRDLPLFKDEELGLGYHLHFILDNQPYQPIFSTDEPIVLNDLEPGTHTIRVFASRPWHESYKNEGAFAETTFHVFTKTPENSPDPRQPLLTFSRPKGDYGAEPVLLDFYLTNAPLHFIAQEDSQDAIPDWQIRCTINGESFTFDRWEPIYLKGLKPGRNWIQLEFLDDSGNPLPNKFNNTVRIIDYQPDGTDALSRLVRGEIPLAIARRITDPDYTPPEPTEETPEEATEPAIEETQETIEEFAPAETPAAETAEPELQTEEEPSKPSPAEDSPEVPAVLEQPAPEESIREELADEVKDQLQSEPDRSTTKSPAALTEKAPEDRTPVLPAPVGQPAKKSTQPDRSNFTDKFSEVRERAKERAKGLMNRVKKPSESAPSEVPAESPSERAIESIPDAPEVPPVIKAPEAIETVPEVTPEKIPEAIDRAAEKPAVQPAKPPSIPPAPELEDLPPTLPEIIEEPQQELTQPDVPPSRLPAPIPRFLTLKVR